MTIRYRCPATLIEIQQLDIFYTIIRLSISITHFGIYYFAASGRHRPRPSYPPCVPQLRHRLQLGLQVGSPISLTAELLPLVEGHAQEDGAALA